MCIRDRIDIFPFVHHIMDNFESLAEEHHIDFVFESEMPSLKLWVDAVSYTHLESW